jgi:hypothetical protein
MVTRADPFDLDELPLLAGMAPDGLVALRPFDPALLGPVAPGSIALLRGPRGVGKSWLALAMAHAIAGTGALLGWQARHVPVLYVEAAMSGAMLGARLRALGPAADLHIVCDERLDLSEADDQARIMETLPEGALLVLDGLSLLVRSGRAGWDSFSKWLRMLRRSGHAVLLVEPTARPMIVALVDTLITLKPMPGEGGVCFAVEIASRQMLAASDRAFAVALALEGRAVWKRAALIPPELRDVIAATRGGSTVREIAAQLGLPVSTAWRRLERAKALGLIDAAETHGTALDDASAAATGVARQESKRREAHGTSGTRPDLTTVATSVLKRTVARRAALQGRVHAHRPGAAILADYDDAELAAECIRRLNPGMPYAPAIAAE